MGIITIPALRPDFPEWSWQSVNGSATLEQVELSYRAVTELLQTWDFAHLVWNDVADLTNQMLSELGLTWDDTYGTLEQCRMPESGSVLMADRFNSAALNISRIGVINWRWGQEPPPPGAVGREEMRGVSRYGHDADFVYGWLILELTKKLNKTISFLKGNETVDDLNVFAEAESRLYGLLALTVKTFFASYPESESYLSGLLGIPPANPIVIAGRASSYKYILAHDIPVVSMLCRVLAASSDLETAAALRVAPVISQEMARSIKTAKASVLGNIPMALTEYYARSFAAAVMASKSARFLSLPDLISTSFCTAAGIAKQARFLTSAAGRESTYGFAELMSKVPGFVSASALSDALWAVSAIACENCPVEGFILGRSYSLPEASVPDPLPVIISGNGISGASGSLISQDGFPIQHISIGESYPLAIIGPGAPTVIGGISAEDSNCYAGMTLILPPWIYPSYTEDNELLIVQVYGAELGQDGILYIE